MKRITAAILCLVIAFCFFGCEKVDHEKLVSEIAELNAERAEKRKAFLEADVTKEAKQYCLDALKELLPEAEIELSLEPGSLLDADLSKYSDFSQNPDTRRGFLGAAYLSFRVNYWDFDVDPETLGAELIDRQISGRMSVRYGSDHYDIDASSGTVTFVQEPGV